MDGNISGLHLTYLEGFMDRRRFMRELALIAGGTAALSVVFPWMGAGSAAAAIVPPDDARLLTEHLEYPGASGSMRAYAARPAGDPGRLPGVLVIHENRGLNAHIEDVCRRVALEGFYAVAPDALSASGGTPADPDRAREMINRLDRRTTIDNFVAAVKYMKTDPRSTGKVGVVGFCWGGAMANQTAVHAPELDAAVPYYGRQPETGDVPRIQAALLLHYAGLDDRINQGIPAFEKALEAASVDYRIHIYEGAQHAFNNDTNGSRYHKEAAELAWKRTISFLNEKLKE